MKKALSRNNLRLQRKRRIRGKVRGTQLRPRLAVFRSLRNIYAQVINDEQGFTLVSSHGKGTKSPNTVEGAREAGKHIAKKCLEKNITEVVFDRGGYKYHGKVKALAEGAREGGLKF